MKVAFLGLGRMGAPMAAHLRDLDLTVWNRTSKAFDGARVAGAVEDAVRDAEVVVTMLFGPDAVREVLADVAKHAPPEALVIESSTIGPDVARQLATTMPQRFVDAPVAGSVKPATEGTLGVLAGGSDEDFAAARPLLERWGDPARVRHVGPVGAGSAMKLVLNLTLGVAMGAVGEALRLAGDLGLDRTAALDVLAQGPLGVTVGTKRPMLESGSYEPAGFSLDLMAKDLALCVEGHDLPLTKAAYDAALAAVAAGRGGEDYAALAGHLAG